MIYCCLCGSHVPGHDMVQAWGATVCRSHLDKASNAPITTIFREAMARRPVTPPETDLVTIQLDWKTARMVAGACVAVAELDDTEGNDAAALHLAWHTIHKSIDDTENKPAPDIDIRG